MPPEERQAIHPRTSGIISLLKAWGSGDEAALARFKDQVYPELRVMARRYVKNEPQGNSLQATALVHEVYLCLVDVANIEWRAQFFAVAAQVMRRILGDASGGRGSRRSGGAPLQVNPDESALVSPSANWSIPALDDALTARYRMAPRQTTIRRDWELAKAWLLRELRHSTPSLRLAAS